MMENHRASTGAGWMHLEDAFGGRNKAGKMGGGRQIMGGVAAFESHFKTPQETDSL